jgi:hypothetical protein
MTVGLSLSGVRGVEPSSKRAHPWSSLPMSSWYACGDNFPCTVFLLLVFLFPNLKKGCLDDRSCTSLVLIARRGSVVTLSIEAPGVGGTPQGAAGMEMVCASPQLGGGSEDLLQDLVVHGTDAVFL